MSEGYSGDNRSSESRYLAGMNAWAVSSGDVEVAAIPEAKVYVLMLAGLVLIGWRVL
ncbi:MAG: hypothetical protein LDL16_06175 [Thiobacillus sp.]|nr:hypothetical protein [Thiobacillus sp.]